MLTKLNKYSNQANDQLYYVTIKIIQFAIFDIFDSYKLTEVKICTQYPNILGY